MRAHRSFPISAPQHGHTASISNLALGVTAYLLGLAATPAFAITAYDITLVGLYDAAHASADGYQYNRARFINNAGEVAGQAFRYNVATGMGESAWVYSDGSTQQIGLTDAAHTRDDGYQDNYLISLNSAGQATGWAYRYNGATYTGRSAWLYSGGNTQEIGLTDAAHSRNGYYSNSSTRVTDLGHVAGEADYYGGAPSGIPAGKSVWFYNGSSTQEIGLTDATHTFGSYGYRNNTLKSLNNVGQVAGNANRYSSSAQNGQSAWLYSGGLTQEIGLTGTAHTRTDGYRFNSAQSLNIAGQVAGQAERFNGATSTGQSAWLYSGGSTQEIGLTGAAHTRDDGYQANTVQSLNSSGQVAGYAERFSGAAKTGYSAWLYDGSSNQEIGLTDAAHTRDDGYRANGALFLNDAGQAAGLASRYNGSTDSGGSAWFYSGGNTQEIGLTGAAYTRDDGYQANTVEFLNILGQAAGYAERFNGAAYAGQSAWFYDPLTNQTYSMDAAVPVPMTYSDSYIMYLGNDGLALGYYSRFDAGGTDLGNGAFSFSVADGWNDLGSLVNGGLDAAGWQQLGEAYRANGAGQIIGNGLLASMNGGAVFLLTPVPEPETWSMLLAGLGLVGAAVRRRRACTA